MWSGATGLSVPARQSSARHDTLPEAGNPAFTVRKIIVDDVPEPSGVPLKRALPYPLGYVDSLMIRCFTHMGSVNFSPQQMFWQRDGAPGGDNSDDALYGFSVPLVGDLNGDGKPEIVALSLNGSLATSASPYLYVFNGQTGDVLTRFTLPAPVRHCADGYHASPCQIVLLDADRNGLGEVIVCFNSTSVSGTNDYRKQIASFEILNRRTFSFRQKWKTSVRYDAWGVNNQSFADGDGSRNYDYPIPQAVDIEGDGIPELIVYNKIYNAVTGAYIMKLEEMGRNPADVRDRKTAYIGSFCLYPYTGDRNGNAHNDTYYESSVAFPAIYDMDGDGKYDFVAGGKIYYNINTKTGTYSILQHAETLDGRTAVADIDGDGRAEVVVQHCNVITQHDVKNFTLTVWEPDFQTKKGVTEGRVTFRADNSYGDWGYSSYLFIGDIDGKTQNGKKLPEISLICGRPFNATGVSLAMTGIPVHPNVLRANGGDGRITSNMSLSPRSDGCLISFTWDDTPGLTRSNRLKVSFMLEHEDRSVNTGFSLFDFDNDGTVDICYRDEQTLRIISAKMSYVTLNETSASVIRLKTPCLSYTAYEYPAIADVDDDGSADMIVMGRSAGGTNNVKSFILVVEGANHDLAPAPTVWNQFHYHPMKINENLQTPVPNFRPLDPDYRFYKNATDDAPSFVYNGNIMQAVISSSYTTANGKEVVTPIVYTADAVVLDTRIATGNKLTFKIANTGNATLFASTPIRIYRNRQTPAQTSAYTGQNLFPGDTAEYSFNIPNMNDMYDIIVGDGTLVDGAFRPGRMRECNWADNHAEVALFLLREDLAVAPRYGTIMIDVLANDVLEGACAGTTLTRDHITTPGGKGVLSGAFGEIRIVNNRLMYTAPGAGDFGGGVLDLAYSITCGATARTAHIYIYIIESCSGSFAACAGSNYTLCLKKTDARMAFKWYAADGATFLGDAFPHIEGISKDTTYFVKPDFSQVATGTWATYSAKDFPKGKLTVKAVGTSGNADTMRWTGSADSDWMNPANWVQIVNGRAKAAAWTPASTGSCVDVVIGKNLPHYPTLNTNDGNTYRYACRNIHLEDRAMIAGIHRLAYAAASMDCEPAPDEKNRFVMLSAPFKHMYTGDYHFAGAANRPEWGLVYMNFFQSANPDYPGSVAAEKTYTATFGSVAAPLPLGKTFNIFVLPDTQGKRFTFPKTSFTTYTDAGGNTTGTLARDSARRFITDNVLTAAGTLQLPVDDAFALIQVANPFAAYLDIRAFLSHPDNAGKIEKAYKTWSGNTDEDFVTVLAAGDTMRYTISDADTVAIDREPFIAPFRSFFVTRKPGAPAFKTLLMSADMTTTVANPSTPRANARIAAPPPVLHITASQPPHANTTAIVYDAGAAPAYRPDEDSRKAFLDGVPVSVYTIADGGTATAIYASGNFDRPVSLGLRLKNASQPVTLHFRGIERFPLPACLIDREAGGTEIDLRRNPSYTFTVRPVPAADAVTELNDRFTLRFDNPGGADNPGAHGIHIYSTSGMIHISASGFVPTAVEIYGITGNLVYRTAVTRAHTSVPAVPGSMYLVRTYVKGGAVFISKVMVLP
jgi:hypothetical protein